MPVVQVNLVEGRSANAKAELIRAVTEAVVQSIGAPRQTVRVILNEVAPEHWGVGGVSKAPPAELEGDIDGNPNRGDTTT